MLSAQLVSCADFIYTRCDTLEYYTQCMFATLKFSSVLTSHLLPSATTCFVSLHTYTAFVSSDCHHAAILLGVLITDSVSILHRCLPLPSRLTELLRRGE